jgi:hypothetical protein
LEVAEGAKVTIPLAHLTRSDFSGSIVQMKAFGGGFERMPQFDLTLTEPGSEAVIDLAALKIPAGEHVVAFYGGAVAKYQYNPDAVHFAQRGHDRAVEAAKQSAAELLRLMAQADTPAESLEAAKTRHQAAEAAVTAAAAKVASATATAAPQDTVDIVVTEPITIRVLPAESK